MKSSILLLLAVAFAAVLAASPAFASEAKKGLDLYKKNCKGCHIAGKEGGALTPISKTQAQWLRFFDRNRHKNYPSAWPSIPEQELQLIRQWLHDRAADSSQPETCG